MGKLTGRFAIVTGAGKGIGKAIVQRFLEDDVAGVALFDMDEELVKATAKELDPTGERAIPVRCNVADQADVNAAVAAVTEKFGRIDILINNAGITRDAMFHKMSSEQAHMVMDVNFFGTFNCCQAVIKGMREQCYGKIVNISSVSTFGSLGQTNYSASKCAIEGFTRTLAIESGMKNITVNNQFIAYITKSNINAAVFDFNRFNCCSCVCIVKTVYKSFCCISHFFAYTFFAIRMNRVSFSGICKGFIKNACKGSA